MVSTKREPVVLLQKQRSMVRTFGRCCFGTVSGSDRSTYGFATFNRRRTFPVLFGCVTNNTFLVLRFASNYVAVFDGGLCQALASTSDVERSSWMDAIRTASYEGVRAELNALRQCIERRRSHKPNIDLHTWRLQQAHVFGSNQSINCCPRTTGTLVTDITEVPLCEISLACDNLLCDGHGMPPNPTLVVDVYMPSNKTWVQYGRTEIIEVRPSAYFKYWKS